MYKCVVGDEVKSEFDDVESALQFALRYWFVKSETIEVCGPNGSFIDRYSS